MNEMHMSKFKVVALETFLIASIGECKFQFILKCRIQKDRCDKRHHQSNINSRLRIDSSSAGLVFHPVQQQQQERS
jgi:hypothetical protein